jgi:predicted MFS family arabinose efflux permease
LTPRQATAGVFFVNGAGAGTLLPHVPDLKDRLDVSAGVIGLCLLAMALGALIAMPLAGQALARHSTRRVLGPAVVAYPVLVAFPLLAGTPLVLAGLLFAVGLANGTLDVTMNAHGAGLERRSGRPLMSSLHAGWSIGGVAGAAAAAGTAAAGADPRAAVAATAAVLVVVGLLCLPRTGQVPAPEAPPGRLVLPSREVLALGALCVLVMLTEGAMNDWSALYLRSSLGAGAAVASAGFGAFSAGMAVGRLGGDAVVARLGATRVLRGGAALAALALGGLLLAGSLGPALFGLALVGLGVANGVPLLFSAAGRQPRPGPAIAAVSTMGYVAFLAGPPFIGFLSDAIGLPGALGTICAAVAAVVLLGGRVAAPQTTVLVCHPPKRSPG